MLSSDKNPIIGAMQTPKRPRAATRTLVVLAAVLVLTGWLLNTPSGLLGKFDSIGYAVCHRIEARSFHVGERALPLCARCSGMYLGAMAGLVYQVFTVKKRSGLPHWSVITILTLFVVAFGIDGSNSYLFLIKETYAGALPEIANLYVPNNTLRLLTGSGMGLALAAFVYPAFNSTVWVDLDEQPNIPGLKTFMPYLGMIALLDLLVLTENPIVLYPLAIISAAGVPVLLTMVYSLVWITIMGQDNQFTSLRQLWLPLVAGFTLALLQIAAIDALRYFLTGTWGAFPIPIVGS